MAHNRIMWVDESSQSLGYYRLQSRRELFSDLDIFLEEKGDPDFLAETSDHMRKYFILYFMRNREAFACRTEVRYPESLEFSGPYPITDKEFALLQGMREKRASDQGWADGPGQ